MNIIFFGNTKYSKVAAEIINTEHKLSAIITLPPRPLGRKKILTPNPVNQFGIDHKILVITVEHWTNEILKRIQNDMGDTDFFIVSDYGRILPKELLSIPKYAPLNIHQSLLPKYRGTSPAPSAILNGDKVSGVTIIKMNEEVDTGLILAQKEYKLKPDETTDSLLIELNKIGGKIIIPVIKDYVKGKVKLQKQDESKATLTKKIAKHDGYIDLDNPPSKEQLDRMIRAYYPWPGVWILLRLSASEGQAKIIKFLPEKKIQMEGRKPMNYKDFFNGYPNLKEMFTFLL